MEVKDNILEAALRLFFKYGIKSITMDDIAKEMSISKKTIYRFFTEKDDIVNALMDIELARNKEAIIQFSKQAKDPIHELILVSQHMQKRYAEINPIFFHDLHKIYGVATEKFMAFKKECVLAHIKKNIETGIKQGLYRAELDVNFVAQYRLLQIDFLTTRDIHFENIQLNKASHHIMELFMHGISTLKGHKLINKYKNKNEEE
ncbi:MAG: TetR/AcrR family transcriptional regulator [Bacteroidetes bacterium]|nr:TetR/AcrR family transcriptional regulator [Bacteroidota bacterium]